MDVDLVKRGISLISTVCPFCKGEKEDVKHIFFECEFSVVIWNWFMTWSGEVHLIPKSILELLYMLKASFQMKKRKKLRFALFYCLIWVI